MLDYRKDQDNCESLDDYKEGGHHPAHLGDGLPRKLPKYRVLVKLGYGVSSTVWLAEVLQNDLAQRHFVSLKVAMSQLSRRGGPSEELSILKLLKAKDHPHSGHATVLHLLDHFQISGPNGEHDVSFTDLIAPMNMILENSQLRNRVSNDYIPKKWTQTWRTGLDS